MTKNDDFIDKYIKNDINKIWKIKTNRNEVFNQIEADFQLYPNTNNIKKIQKPFVYKHSLDVFSQQTFLSVKDSDTIRKKIPLYKQFDSLKCDDFEYQPEYDRR